jgi:CopG family nickel-responsive transcriptional regulator
VQGSAKKVQKIADEMITLRGVVTGKLQLLAALMPPIAA